MSLKRRFQGWSRKRRRKKAAEESRREPLREFVYLDEVSVFSLLASRIGALATDFTASESASLSSDIRGGGGITVPGARAGLESTVSAGHTSETQVMRKSTVQSTFKEFYGYVRDSLVIGPPMSNPVAPRVSNVAGLREMADNRSDWVVDSLRLKRGDLLEVEVELEADPSFRARTVMSTMLEFIEDLPQLAGTLDAETRGNVVAGTKVLEKLLVGLIPIRGRVADFSCVEVDGGELVVHNSLLHALDDLRSHARPLYVVGVAEEALFWRDIRRVLFSNARYRILCRLGRDGSQSDWTPVKLLDVLEGVVPRMRDIIESIPTALVDAGARDRDESDAVVRLRQALLRYAQDVTARYGKPLTVEDLAARGLPTREHCEAHDTPEARRKAFASLTKALTEELGFVAEPEVLATHRTAALMEAQVLALPPGPRKAARTDDPNGADARYLDTEIVAVYW